MSAKNTIKEIKRTTKKRFTAEQKIQIVLVGLRGEIPITDLCEEKISLSQLTIPGPRLSSRVANPACKWTLKEILPAMKLRVSQTRTQI